MKRALNRCEACFNWVWMVQLTWTLLVHGQSRIYEAKLYDTESMHEASKQRRKAACVLPIQRYANLLVALYSRLLNTLSFRLQPRTASSNASNTLELHGKQRCQQFGFPCLYKLSQHNSFKSWINPVGKLENQGVRTVLYEILLYHKSCLQFNFCRVLYLHEMLTVL